MKSIVIQIQGPFMQRVYETLETQYEEFHSDNLALARKNSAESVIVSSVTLLGGVSSWPQNNSIKHTRS